MAALNDFAYLGAIGVDVAKVGPSLRHHRSRLAEFMVARSGQESFRKEYVIMLLDLWGAKDLSEAGHEETGRVLEMVVKSMLSRCNKSCRQ